MKKICLIRSTFKKSLVFLMAVSLMLLTLYSFPSSAETVPYVEPTEEMRGVWVATVSNIDIPKQAGTSEAAINQWKQNYLAILDRIKLNKMNAIFFQVRPANDAFYPSQYNPWSDYLAGYGVDPGWDPLAWMIEVTHAEGIEFHAWLNPYRTSVTSYSVKYDTALSAGTINTVKTEVQDYKRSYASGRRSMAGNGYDNPFLDPVDASFQQKVLMGAEGRMVLNPAHEATLTHLANTISEIITNYEVDGIHFDDYFYPAAEKYDGYPVEPWADNADYDEYRAKGGTLSKPDWRRNNVDRMVEMVSDLVEEHNQKPGAHRVAFGISPAHMWAPDPENCPSSGVPGGTVGAPCWGYSTYNQLYADTKKWVEEEWIDYILPQLYMEFGDSYRMFVNWWANVVEPTDVKLYIGTPVYRINEWNDERAISKQMYYNGTTSELVGKIHGYVLYNYTSVASGGLFARGMGLIRGYWQKGALTPVYGEIDAPTPDIPDFSIIEKGDKLQISFAEVENAKGYAIYRFKKNAEYEFTKANMVALVNQTNTGKVHNVEATAEDDDVFLMRVFDLNNQLVDGYVEKDTSVIIPNLAPVITDVDFGLKDNIKGGDEVTVKAKVSDPESAPLAVTLKIAIDGVAYKYEFPMTLDENGFYSYTWVAYYLNSENTKMKIVASDGYKTTEVESEPFVLGNPVVNQAPVISDVSFGIDSQVDGKSKVTISAKVTDDSDSLSITLYFAKDGSTFQKVHEFTKNATGNYSFEWTVPNEEASGALLKIVASDGEFETESVSEAFQIVPKTASGGCKMGSGWMIILSQIIVLSSVLVLMRKRGKM